MKAALWNDKGTLDVVDKPVPDPKPGWVRLRVVSVGICGTDLHFYRGAFPSPVGLQPGHEIGGTVDAAGPGASFATGMAVAVDPLVVCGECAQCRTGNPNRCAKRVLLGVNGRGGCAEFVVAPAYAVYPLPEGVSPVAGALVEPLAVCVHGTRRARVTSGDRVAILGGGTIGLMAILTSRVAGASEVAITARHAHQREAARTLGADRIFEDADAMIREASDAPFDCVIETVGGQASTLSEAVRLARPGGIVSMLGVFEGPSAIPALDVSLKELTLVGSNCYGRVGPRTDFSIAVELLRKHGSELESLVTHRFRLAEVNAAFAAAVDKRSGSIKVHILPE
ncbi:MAG TPA: alcohol dehydrogenase catalytic domain-containing protein [Candidatus Binatia bacterium]|nr:alcohol dehydrogenase catalytic domain-containing protein [Candidatus Binatia bacterium]